MRKGVLKIGFTETTVLTIVVAAVLLFVVWQLASTKVVPETKDLQNEVRFLSGELAPIKARLERLQAKQVVVEREADVLRLANHMLKEHESERQAQLGQLQSELDFYRRLAGTGGAQSGLDI